MCYEIEKNTQKQQYSSKERSCVFHSKEQYPVQLKQQRK